MISGPMTRYNLKGWMRKGPFRQFVVMEKGEPRFPGFLIAKVLAQEVRVKDQRPDELWYRIGGQNHKFGKQEFALITGLRFGKINKKYMKLEAEQLHEGNICQELWPNKKGSVKCAEVELRLKEGPPLKKAQAKRLLLVVMMQRIFFGMRKDACVPLFLWHMVQDIKNFCRFPWGTLIYCKMIKCMRNAITRELIDENKSPCFRFFGWPFAVRYLHSIYIIY